MKGKLACAVCGAVVFLEQSAPAKHRERPKARTEWRRNGATAKGTAVTQSSTPQNTDRKIAREDQPSNYACEWVGEVRWF